MGTTPVHASRPKLVARLKRADGHPCAVIETVEADEPCVDVAQRLRAVERAVIDAERVPIRERIDRRLDVDGQATDRAKLRDVARHL